MKDRNICKFIDGAISEKLTTKSFIYESNAETMRLEIRMTANRIILLSEGSGVWHINDSVFELKKGDLAFIFTDEHVHVEPRDGCEYIYIVADGMRCQELFRRFGISPQNRHFPGNEGLIAFWTEAISRATGLNLDLISESVVLYSLSLLAVPEGGVGGIAERVLEIIDEDYSDPKLSLISISQRLGYNTKYLSHIFKEKTGRGFAEYLRTVRVRQAVFLFEHGLESVKNVAYFCGFEDPLYFSTVFKKVVGVSPNAYMKQIEDNKHSVVDN